MLYHVVKYSRQGKSGAFQHWGVGRWGLLVTIIHHQLPFKQKKSQRVAEMKYENVSDLNYAIRFLWDGHVIAL